VRLLAIILLVLALVCETFCWFGFFSAWPQQQSILLFYLLHLLGSLFSAAFMVRIIPATYRRQPLAAGVLFFFICLFLPSLGLVGMVLALWPAFVRRRRREAELYEQHESPELPYKPLQIGGQSLYGQAGMLSVLRQSPESERRVKVVMATKQMTSQEAIPVLKEALKDPEDDVRLLAYAMLNGKEEELSRKINALLGQLKSYQRKHDRQRLHESISNSYWEMAYLGLCQGEVLKHVLGQSLEHLESALDCGATDSGLFVQHGRLLLQLQCLDDAVKAFNRAVERGIPIAAVAPYLAEIAFVQRDFSEVKMQMQQLGGAARKSERLATLAGYWA